MHPLSLRELPMEEMVNYSKSPDDTVHRYRNFYVFALIAL